MCLFIFIDITKATLDKSLKPILYYLTDKSKYTETNWISMIIFFKGSVSYSSGWPQIHYEHMNTGSPDL